MDHVSEMYRIVNAARFYYRTGGITMYAARVQESVLYQKGGYVVKMYAIGRLQGPHEIHVTMDLNLDLRSILYIF